MNIMVGAVVCLFSLSALANSATIVALNSDKKKIRVELNNDGYLSTTGDFNDSPDGSFGSHPTILDFDDNTPSFSRFCYEGDSEGMIPLLTALVKGTFDPYADSDASTVTAGTIKYIHMNVGNEVKIGAKIIVNPGNKMRLVTATFQSCARF